MTEPAELGATRENPVYFKFLRDEEDRLDWKKIVLMLGLTVLSGYLATASQRAGSHPDQLRSARMRVHKTAERLASGQARLWSEIAKHQHDLYEIARM